MFFETFEYERATGSCLLSEQQMGLRQKERNVYTFPTVFFAFSIFLQTESQQKCRQPKSLSQPVRNVILVMCSFLRPLASFWMQKNKWCNSPFVPKSGFFPSEYVIIQWRIVPLTWQCITETLLMSSFRSTSANLKISNDAIQHATPWSFSPNS